MSNGQPPPITPIQPFNLGKWFIVGVNLAWLDGQYDHDFGNNELMKNVCNISSPPYYSTDPNAQKNWEKYCKLMSKWGISVIRMWAFERGEGLHIEKSGSNYKIIGLDKIFEENFAHACYIAYENKMKIYLSLIDTRGFHDATFTPSQNNTFINFTKNIVENPDDFLDKAVIPLIEHEYIKGTIFAVDVINEPEGLIKDCKIEWKSITGYINTCAYKLSDKVKISCGLQKSENLEKIKNCYVDFFDFHHYDDDGNLEKKYSELKLDKPCIIGECGQELEKYNLDIQEKSLKNFYQNAHMDGFRGCFAWAFHGKYSESDKVKKDYYRALVYWDGIPKPVTNLIRDFAKARASEAPPWRAPSK